MTMVGTQLDGDFSLLVGELMAGSSVADPYHVDTDPDPGNYTDPDPQHWQAGPLI